MTEESPKIANSGGTSPVHLKAIKLLEIFRPTYKTLSRRFMPILKIMRPALRAVKRALSVRMQLLKRLLQLK